MKLKIHVYLFKKNRKIFYKTYKHILKPCLPKIIFKSKLYRILIMHYRDYKTNQQIKSNLSKDYISYTRYKIVPYYLDPFSQEISEITNFSIAVHLHLFYADMTDEFINYLKKIPYKFDLFVSVQESVNTEPVKIIFLKGCVNIENVIVENVPNRGRDVSPFIVQFGKRLLKYDIICHIHSKGSYFSNKLNKWRSNIMDILFDSPQSISQIIDLLRDDANIVFPEDNPNIVLPPDGWGDPKNLMEAKTILSKYTNYDTNDYADVKFPQGHMFWCRSDALKHYLKLPLKYSDFPEEPIRSDGTICHALERLVLVFASKSKGRCYQIHKNDSMKEYRYFEEQRDYSRTISKRHVKILSYYLPQFHPIPENDLWHGKGFTEWTKVRKANPLFIGHYQQHIPHEDIGYYLLDSPEILKIQLDMMNKSGVYGQIFYHYWFTGKLILEEPVKILLDNPDIDMPFCFCWANENWTKKWDGNETEVLLKQDYSEDDASAFIKYLLPFFKDSRYIRIHNRPVLYIYRPSSIPDFNLYRKVWEEVCRKEGLEAPYVVAVLTRGAISPSDFGMDAGSERVLHDWTGEAVNNIIPDLIKYWPMNGSVLRYSDVAEFYGNQKEKKNFTYFRSIIPTWDNTARYASESYVIHDSNPYLFQSWLKNIVDYTIMNNDKDEQFIVVNAWNEWAEGAHLEPDQRFGYGYLNSIGRVLSDLPYDEFDSIKQNSLLHYNITLKFVITDNVIESLKSNKRVFDKFVYCLINSTVMKKYKIAVDSEYLREIFMKNSINIVENTGSVDCCEILFGLVCYFAPDMIEKMLDSCIFHRTSVISANCFSFIAGNDNAIITNENMSISSSNAFAVRMYPPGVENFKNHKISSESVCFISNNNTRESNLPVVTTIIRFHKSGDLKLMNNALLSLLAQEDCIVQPLIAVQDLNDNQIDELKKMISWYKWDEGYEPLIVKYESTKEHPDLRSKMLNESFKSVKSMYSAILDYDDILFPFAYKWLIERLTLTGKAVTYGNVYLSLFNRQRMRVIKRNREFEYGYNYNDFIKHNHSPVHSIMFNMNKIDISNLKYCDGMKYMEDYYMTLQIVNETNTDWESLVLKKYIGDYIHSIDEKHTLAITNDKEREELVNNPEFIKCKEKIAEIKNIISTKNAAFK